MGKAATVLGLGHLSFLLALLTHYSIAAAVPSAQCNTTALQTDFAATIDLTENRANLSRNDACAPYLATAFAVAYARPLGSFAALAQGIWEENGRTNKLLHQRNFTTNFASREAAVIPPRADSLLSRAVLDLNKNDLILQLPQVPADRFYSCAFYDVYGNNIAYLSNVEASKADSYLLTFAGAGRTRRDSATSKRNTIQFPTAFGFMLVRYQSSLDDAGDTKLVNKLQDQTTLRITANRSTSHGGSLTDFFNAQVFPDPYGNHPDKLMDTLAAIHTVAPPLDRADSQRVSSLLHLAGISDNGTYNARENVDLASMYYLAGNSSAVAYASAISPVQGEWSTLPGNETGSFGTGYAIRAIQSVIGFGQTRAELEFAPTWNIDASPALYTSLDIGAEESVTVRFHGVPPLQKGGFWSLAVYSLDEFAAQRLIPNSRGKYSITSATRGLRYADGTQVGGPHNDSGKDWDIRLSAANNPPSQNWTANWLPVGDEGGPFVLDVRFYGAPEKLLDGSYTLPSIIF